MVSCDDLGDRCICAREEELGMPGNDSYNCDMCDRRIRDDWDAWCNPHPRPSDPSECVSTMWVCGTCAEREELAGGEWLPRFVVAALVEEGEPVFGRRYMWQSV